MLISMEGNKFQDLFNWFSNELVLANNHPSEDVQLWASMLQEALEYNLAKFE